MSASDNESVMADLAEDELIHVGLLQEIGAALYHRIPVDHKAMDMGGGCNITCDAYYSWVTYGNINCS